MVSIEGKSLIDIGGGFKAIETQADDAAAFPVEVGAVHAAKVGQFVLRLAVQPGVGDQDVVKVA